MESCRFWGTGPSSMGRDGPVDTFLSPENLGPGLGREPLVIEAYSTFQSLAIPVSLLMGELFQISWS